MQNRLLATIGIAFILLCAFLWLRTEPTVRVTRVYSDPLTLALKTSGINGLLSVHFYSETRKAYLWIIGINNQPMSEITYGIVPSKGEQIFPQTGEPSPPKGGEKLLIEIAYQFDTFTEACAGATVWSLELD